MCSQNEEQRLWGQQDWVVLPLGKALTSEPQCPHLKSVNEPRTALRDRADQLGQSRPMASTVRRPPLLLGGVGSWCVEISEARGSPRPTRVPRASGSGSAASHQAGPRKLTNGVGTRPGEAGFSPQGRAWHGAHARGPASGDLIPNAPRIQNSAMIEREANPECYCCSNANTKYVTHRLKFP